MSLTLAIETATLAGGVALGRGDEPDVTRALPAVRNHAADLLPLIAELLGNAGATPADVDVLCYSQGPGSFTGLRVAATVARMWHAVRGCRVVGVPTLAVLAENAPLDAARVAVLTDARGGRAFAAEFARDDAGVLNFVRPTDIVDPAAWLGTVRVPAVLIADAPAKLLGAPAAGGRTDLPPDLALLPPECACVDVRHTYRVGRRLAAAGAFLEPAQITPAYHRRPECEEVYEQRRAAAREKRGE